MGFAPGIDIFPPVTFCSRHPILPYESPPFRRPALALIAGVFWVGGQETTLTVLREKTLVLKNRLGKFAEVRALADPDRPAAGGAIAETDEFSLPDGSTDWEAIARFMAEIQNSGGMPNNMKSMLKLQKRFMELSEDEIADGMAKVGNLDLEEAMRSQLQAGLLRQLAEKNPERALEFMGDAITGWENPLLVGFSGVPSQSSRWKNASRISHSRPRVSKRR